MKWKQIPEEAAHLFDLPEDALAGMPRITLTGRSRVCVENHRGLLSYTAERVEVGGKVGVCVTGSDLQLRVMGADALVVTGTIFNVELL